MNNENTGPAPDQLIAIVQFPQDENGAHEDEIFGPFDTTEQRVQWVTDMTPIWPNAMFILTELQHPQTALLLRK